jgi:hypothetical protein
MEHCLKAQVPTRFPLRMTHGFHLPALQGVKVGEKLLWQWLLSAEVHGYINLGHCRGIAMSSSILWEVLQLMLALALSFGALIVWTKH